MATNAQIDANRRNSQSSTGPRSESGKSKSSRNRLTYGLYTHADYVKPDETEIYAEFCKALYEDLTPDNLLEETFVFEITGASWRLRRCAAAEADLADYREGDPLLDEATDKTRRGIERARAAAHSVIQRSLNQLRKLRTDRIIREKPVAGQKADIKDPEREAQQASSDLASNCNAGDLVAGSLASNCNAGDLVAGSLASNCKPNGHPAKAASVQVPAPQIARNALCPCKSGEKYKRCCGKNAPPVLGKAA